MFGSANFSQPYACHNPSGQKKGCGTLVVSGTTAPRKCLDRQIPQTKCLPQPFWRPKRDPQSANIVIATTVLDRKKDVAHLLSAEPRPPVNVWIGNFANQMLATTLLEAKTGPPKALTLWLPHPYLGFIKVFCV